MIVLDDSARPAIRPHYDVVPIDTEAVLIRSPDRGLRARVDGVAADDLAAWIRGLDGTRTAGRLRREGPEHDGLDTLLRELVVRDVVRLNAPRDALADDTRFFAHHHDDPSGCRRRLIESRVVICGSGRLPALVRGSLRAAGVRRADLVRHLAPNDDSAAVAEPGPPLGSAEADGDGGRIDADALDRECRGADLVIASLAAPGDPLAETLAAIASRARVAWLPLLLFGGTGLVGPLFVAGDGPCHACLVAREQANWADPELTRLYYDRVARDRSSLRRYGSLPAFEALMSEWAVLEATKFLSRFTIPALLGCLLRIDFMRGTTQTHRVLKVPRCRRCSPAVQRPYVNGHLFSRPS
jgi:bacteriocin biosynthesis cyclodehydratase domain-containing protein